MRPINFCLTPLLPVPLTDYLIFLNVASSDIHKNWHSELYDPLSLLYLDYNLTTQRRYVYG